MVYNGSHFVLAINVLKTLMIRRLQFFLEICMECVEQLELEIELMLDSRSLLQRLHFT